MKSLEFREKILKIIREQVVSSRGNLVTFRASKIAKQLSKEYSKNGKAITLAVKEYLEVLVKYGYLEVIKETSRGRIYGLKRNSPLWKLLENASPSDIRELVEVLTARAAGAETS